MRFKRGENSMIIIILIVALIILLLIWGIVTYNRLVTESSGGAFID